MSNNKKVVLCSIFPLFIAASLLIFNNSNIENENLIFQNKSEIFENGDTYNINRITFNESQPDPSTHSLQIKGDDIVIRYIDPETLLPVTTNDISNIKHTTLMISTDIESCLISVPAVYSSDTSFNTMSILREKEIPLSIQKHENSYIINISFPQETDIICEYWYLYSQNGMEYFTDSLTFDDFLFHDLSQNIRWTFDGYYFQTPHNYAPGGEGVLYKHPSGLAGASLSKYGKSQFSKNFGFLMLENAISYQNNQGFWPTGPKSEWLSTDFNIGAGFYDTRFNSDIALSLMEMYIKTNDETFLNPVIDYLDFYIDFVKDNSYITKNGGIFVADYGHTIPHEKTHVSLNHHITEIRVLLNAYLITNDQSYLDLANKMILAVEDTKNQWILPNGNLKYELYYTKSSNIMQDYLYLTYNDLFIIQNLLADSFDGRNQTFDYLMDSKRGWLIKNNAHDYLK